MCLRETKPMFALEILKQKDYSALHLERNGFCLTDVILLGTIMKHRMHKSQGTSASEIVVFVEDEMKAGFISVCNRFKSIIFVIYCSNFPRGLIKRNEKMSNIG